MADLTATSTITLKKGKRAMAQSNTIAQIGARTYTVTLPNPANATDLVVLGKFPAGCAPIGVFTKANANLASNTGLEFGLSANANGAGATVLIANVATGVHTNWGYATAATTSNLGAQSDSADSYLVMTVRGNATGAVHTVTVTVLIAGIDAETATFSTFTN